MIDNGFTPEWIQLSKEIREETDELKKRLSEVRNDLGELPLSINDDTTWRNNLEKFETLAKQINSKIDKYNLVVPILQKQMLHINLEELAKKALAVPPLKKNAIKKYADNSRQNLNENISQDLFNFIIDVFSKKVR